MGCHTSSPVAEAADSAGSVYRRGGDSRTRNVGSPGLVLGATSARIVAADSDAVTQPVDRSAFDTLHVMGQGGFGRVTAVIKNRGFDKGTAYALKAASKAAVLRKNHVTMVMRERSLHAKLQCPQLVNMHYAFQDARHLYIAMDLCLGGDLQFQLSQHPERRFPEAQARFYVAGVILCLEYMHGVGVLHRRVRGRAGGVRWVRC